MTHPWPDIELLILDLDGTVRTCTVRNQPCPNRPGEQALVPGIGGVLAAWQAAGVPVSIATNQGGIALGFMEEQDLLDQLVELRALLSAEGVDAGAIPMRYCRHRPRGGCGCRKPKPGMLTELMGRFQVAPDATLFVGDREPDRGAAEAAGCRFAWAWDFHPWHGYPELRRR